MQVAAACGLPASVVARAAQVARLAERGSAVAMSSGSSGGSRGEEEAAGSGGSPGRRPLGAANQLAHKVALLPGKRRRLLGAAVQEQEQAPPQKCAGGTERVEALAAVRAAVRGMMQGVPGAAERLLRLHEAARSALAGGQL